MNEKIAVDTNVLIYLHDDNIPVVADLKSATPENGTVRYAEAGRCHFKSRPTEILNPAQQKNCLFG